MIRERLAAVALLAYPPPTRAARGEEMAGTLLDAGAGSRRRLARELAGLVRAGLRARGEETARAGRLVGDGVCLAGAWVMTLDLATLLAWRERGFDGPLLGWPSIALLAAALALALVGFDRLAGAAALAWTGFRLPALSHLHPVLLGLVPEILPALCFAVLVLAPRRRAPAPRRLGWLIVPVWLALALGPHNPLLVAGVALGAIAAVALALASLPVDPRLAIAGALPLTSVAIGVAATQHDLAPPIVLMVAATPAVLAVARTRRPARR
jgi:hypothetical protein